MDHQQTELLRQLKTFIESNRNVAFKQTIEPRALEDDFRWDASRFWAEVLFAAIPSHQEPTLAELETFAKEFQEKKGVEVKITDLIKEHWVRQILGLVRVAAGIRSVVRQYQKVAALKKELEFMSFFYHQQSAERSQIKVTTAAIETALVAYQSEHGTTLNKEAILSPPWAQVKGENVEISAIDIYFDPILEHWERLKFLSHWEARSEGRNDSLWIRKEQFESIHQKFIHFKDAPSIETMVANKSIEIDTETYLIKVSHHHASYPEVLSDKIAGLLWEMILREETYSTDKDRLTKWMNKILTVDNWPNHLPYVTFHAKECFLDAAMKLLVEQEDLKGLAFELTKVRLDNNHKIGAEALYKKAPGIFDHYALKDENIFEVYQCFHRLENDAHVTFLHEQPSRHELWFLVHCIVRHDTEPNVNAGAYLSTSCVRIKSLLRQGLMSPFFVWSVTEAIEHHRPGVLPFLLIEPEFCGLALSLIDQLKFAEDQDTKITKTWLFAMQLLLPSLPDIEKDSNNCATIVYQLFRQLNHGKYSFSHNKTSAQREQTRQLQNNREQQVLELLENYSTTKGLLVGGSPRYLVIELFDLLIGLFTKYEEPQLYRNGTVQFPLLKWDGLFWLLKLTTYWKYRETFVTNSEKAEQIAEAFLAQYLDLIEQEDTTVYDYFEGREKIDIPLWSERIERLDLLDWIYTIYTIDKIGKLNTFLSPRISFEREDTTYNRKNNFIADKLRTHIGVLLQILRKLVIPSIPYGFEKSSLLNIKEQIEKQVVVYIRRYSKDLPSERRLDIFSYQKENPSYTSEKEALLPKIAQAINWFSQKEEVINALAETGDIVKLLVLMDYITVEGIQERLLEKIKSTDLIAYLSNSNWIPEIQIVLSKLSQYPQLLPQLEKAADLWRDRVVRKRKENNYKEQLFVTELLIAYLKKDLKAIDSIEEPDSFAGSANEINHYRYKQFYKALVYLDTEPEKSASMFTDLSNRYPTYPTIALNRMAAKLKFGTQTKDAAIFREAYEEWNEQQKKHFNDRDTASLEPSLSANLMSLLFELEEHEQLEERYNRLDLPNRMALSVVEIRVKSLRVRNKISEALSLIDSAKTYHQFAGVQPIQFLIDLEVEVRGVDNIDELKFQFHRIFANAPDKLVRILPPAFNGKQDISEFLVKEIANASSKMLDKIKSIDKIADENKYNDIVELLLDSRINIFGWHIGDQSRGGFSAPSDRSKGKQPGERDLPIMDINKSILMVCEAFIYRGKATAVPHLQKIFDYHHQRKAMTILIYDTAERSSGFNVNWTTYISDIIPDTKFPSGMEISGVVEDVSTAFGYDISAIKIGRSLHGQNTLIYHIFVNINYKLG